MPTTKTSISETKLRQQDTLRLHKPIALFALVIISLVTHNVTKLLAIRFSNPFAGKALALNTPPYKNSPRRDLFFNSTIPPYFIKATRPLTPKCIIFSCTDAGYFLVDPHLTIHGAKFCDRVHFTGRTTDETGKTVPAVWCRVALFRVMNKLFQRYQKVIYTDVDIVYDEKGLLQLHCGNGLKGTVVSTKVEKGVTVLRIPWIIICDRTDEKSMQMVDTWARKHREVYLRDQTVFNENWSCKEVTCYNRTITQKAEIRHCGSWLSEQERLKCLQTR